MLLDVDKSSDRLRSLYPRRSTISLVELFSEKCSGVKLFGNRANKALKIWVKIDELSVSYDREYTFHNIGVNSGKQ